MQGRILLLAVLGAGILGVLGGEDAQDGAVAATPDSSEYVVVDHGDHVHKVKKMSPKEEHDAIMMLFLVFGGMVVGQVVLSMWQARHPKSFRLVTLVGVWAVPFLISAFAFYWRFLFVWLLYSTGTGLNVYAASRPNMQRDVPKRVYAWFLLVHKLSQGLGTVGYWGFLAELFGIRAALWLPDWVGTIWILALFYGLYFGVLGRDSAEVCTDYVHARMGYVRPKDDDGHGDAYVPPNMCALCGEELRNMHNEGGDRADGQKLVALGCKHEFHEYCMRGWLMVGKRDTCPNCSEKTDTEEVLGSSPWQKHSRLWGQVLDVARYLLAWNPIIIAVVQLVGHMMGWK